MKRIIKSVIITFLLFLCVLPAKKTFAATAMNMTLGAGHYANLDLKTNSKVKWKSTNTAVATVSREGFVKGKGIGRATVTATLGSKVYKYSVSVKKGTINNELNIATATAGSVIVSTRLDFANEGKYFKSYSISTTSSVYKRIKGKSFNPSGKVKLSDLRYIKLLHFNWKHRIQVGELIVNKAIASDIISIFKNLFDYEYEVQQMKLIDSNGIWKGTGSVSDSYSCSINNTSAFCYRCATGTSDLSNHAYGRAIDFNPKMNPYCYKKDGKWTCSRATESKYVHINRNVASTIKGVITRKDYAYRLFVNRGFEWGGDWTSEKDYQHFQKK